MKSSNVKKIYSIIKKNSLHAYLGTADGRQPVVRPVSPIVEPDLSLWITTYSTSRKVNQIKKNPKICLAFVEQPNGDKSATVIGKAKIINDMQQKKRIWDLAPFDISQHFPEGAASKEYCLIKIIIKKIEWRDSWTGRAKIFQPKG